MTSFLLSAGLILAAGIVAALGSRSPARADRAFHYLFTLGCAIGVGLAIAVLAGATPDSFSLRSAIPGGPWVFGIDAVSAVFLLAIFIAGGAAAWYGVSYLEHARSHRSVGGAHLLFAVLVVSLAVVAITRAVVPFLIAWEVMALTAYFLIVFERERPDVRRAGMLYLAATHTGTLALFAAFALWGGAEGDLTFATLAQRAPAVLEGSAWLLPLILLGFGLKAGLVPLHFWLPSAHAAAPSHVSAIMSGVVIKAGIYGIMRSILLLGTPPAWLGWLLLGAGAISGVLGVIWALAQHDLKRLLAYHSVENIGIILLGLGAGVLGVAYEQPLVAMLGFAGAALHLLNHALFKSLLFLGAGCVITGTGTREIDRLGGLWRTMPRTATAFLIGSAAIVGLPPLNGFLSEWLVVRSLLSTFDAPDTSRVAILFAAALGLIGALALACFAKVVGAVFLGQARDPAFAMAREPGRGMTGPALVLAMVCTLIGLLPVLVLPGALRAGALLAGLTPDPWLRDAAALPLTVFGLLLALALALVWWVSARLRAARQVATSETWGCGYDLVTARMQYTASSFAAPVLLTFRSVAGVQVTRSAHAYHTHPTDPVMDGLVLRVWHWVQDLAHRVRPIQRGRLSHYLLYIVLTVVALMVYLLAAT